MPRAVTLRLGWRFLRVRDRRRLTSMGLVVVGVAFATLSVLSGLAAFATVGDRSDRTAARASLIASDAVRPDAWMMDLRKPYGNAMLRRVDIALSEHPPPPPPGLDRWPQPNEQFVSPAYLSAVEDDTRLRSYAPGEVIGTIASAGLRSPDELVVYRGVERSELPRGGVNVITRHAEPVTALSLDTVELSGGQVIGLMAVFGVLVGLPIVAFLAVASACRRARAPVAWPRCTFSGCRQRVCEP